MTREEAARIYLDGLMNKNVEIEKFFDASRALSPEDRAKLQMSVDGYKMAWIGLDKMESNSF